MLDRTAKLLRQFSDVYFQADDDGRIVYYPWGTLGGGLVIPTEAFRDRIGLIYSVYLFAAVAIGVLSTRFAPITTVIAATVHVVTFIAFVATLCGRVPRRSIPIDHPIN